MSTTIRRSPFNEMVSLHNVMNQLFDESLSRSSASAKNIVPAMDIAETSASFELELALPGLKAEDLQITFAENVLTISGEVRREAQEERTIHRSERRFGSFKRAVTLPRLVNGDAITARLEQGVLFVSVPKVEAVKPRTIEVSVN